MTVLVSILMPDIAEGTAVTTILCESVGGARGVASTANAQPGKSP